MWNRLYIVLGLSDAFLTLPVDGLLTNLNLRSGSQALANQPALAQGDGNSF
jgi:multidrug resistance efflux pump